MRAILAPEEVKLEKGEITCFLAGGITNCPTWQNDVTRAIEKYFDFMKQEIPGSEDGDDLVLINPRRENFPINQPNAAREQITWEFNNLQRMDIFSMFLCSGPSDQPICMYELGRNLVTMQQRFPRDYQDRIVITCDYEYSRCADVMIQTELAFNRKNYFLQCEGDYDLLIEKHAAAIIKAYHIVQENRARFYKFF